MLFICLLPYTPPFPLKPCFAAQVANHLGQARSSVAASVQVSAVLVHRNRPHLLAHALASLEQQDHPHLEVGAETSGMSMLSAWLLLLGTQTVWVM